jgi:hypothetical protein
MLYYRPLCPALQSLALPGSALPTDATLAALASPLGGCRGLTSLNVSGEAARPRPLALRPLSVPSGWCCL